jgi:hypothetical protein
MDLRQLREELTEDEGCKYEIYLDHLGYPDIFHICNPHLPLVLL